MAELTADTLETILRHISAAAPEPWYPKRYAESANVERDSLDIPVEKLRLANLIRLTEWTPSGQGYVLTPEGAHALNDGRTLANVRAGKARPQPAPVRSPETRATAYEHG